MKTKTLKEIIELHGNEPIYDINGEPYGMLSELADIEDKWHRSGDDICYSSSSRFGECLGAEIYLYPTSDWRVKFDI